MADVVRALNVRVVGTGSQYVVLAHGFGMDQSAWWRVVPYLTGDYRVILFDLACSGSVRRDYFDWSRHNSLHGYVEDLFRILDDLGVNSCTYIGHSISALIGLIASVRRPSLFSKLILMVASPRYLNDERHEKGFAIRTIQYLFATMESNYVAWANGFGSLAIENERDEETELSRTMFNLRPDISMLVCQSVFGFDFKDVLRSVRSRCIIILTTRENTVPAAITAYIDANIGGRTSFMLLDAEGHIPHVSAPTVTGNALRRALRAV